MYDIFLENVFYIVEKNFDEIICYNVIKIGFWFLKNYINNSICNVGIEKNIWIFYKFVFNYIVFVLCVYKCLLVNDENLFVL